MNYPEREIWRMTMRKLLALWREYKRMLGLDDPNNPADAIPEDVM